MYNNSKKKVVNKKVVNKKVGEISESNMKKLKEHSKMHKGMKSKHMLNMIKFMKAGDSFSKAHMKSKALDKKSTY